MNKSELLAYIKSEVEEAELNKRKDAVNMYFVIKHAQELREIHPVEFAKAIGRTEAYATKFRKGFTRPAYAMNLKTKRERRGLKISFETFTELIDSLVNNENDGIRCDIVMGTHAIEAVLVDIDRVRPGESLQMLVSKYLGNDGVPGGTPEWLVERLLEYHWLRQKFSERPPF